LGRPIPALVVITNQIGCRLSELLASIVDACVVGEQLLAAVRTEVGFADEGDASQWGVDAAVDRSKILDKLLALLFDRRGNEDVVELLGLPEQRCRRGECGHRFPGAAGALHGRRRSR